MVTGCPGIELVVKIGADAVVSQLAGEGSPAGPGPEPDLSGLAVFTLDPAGRVTDWSVTAAALFGRTADEVTGQDVCAVLLTAPGQRELVAAALAATAAQRTWSAALDVPAGSADTRVTLHCEPLAGPQPDLVDAERRHPERAPERDKALLSGGVELGEREAGLHHVDATPSHVSDSAAVSPP